MFFCCRYCTMMDWCTVFCYVVWHVWYAKILSLTWRAISYSFFFFFFCLLFSCFCNLFYFCCFMPFSSTLLMWNALWVTNGGLVLNTRVWKAGYMSLRIVWFRNLYLNIRRYVPLIIRLLFDLRHFIFKITKRFGLDCKHSFNFAKKRKEW